VPRKKSSKPSGVISEKQRESDDELRRLLESADPDVFKRAVEPLFRNTGEANQKRKSG
jgi:hypothetical protein